MTTKYFKAIYGFTTGTAITLDASSGNISANNANVTNQLISTVATGTAPLAVTSTTRVNNLNVAYANVADNINVTAPGTGTGYIVFANATTGNVTEWTSGGITSNLANSSITATTFVGALSGTASSATTATTATSATTATNASALLTTLTSTGTAFIPFISATANGNYAHLSNAAFAANLANGAIIATTFVGTLSGAASSVTNALTIGSGLGGTSYNGSSAVTITNTGVTSIVAGTNISVSGATGAVTVNVSGTVANATFATSAGTATSATTATNASALLTTLTSTGTAFIPFISATANGNYAHLSNANFSANLANGAITATTFVGALSGAATSAGSVTNALTIGSGLGGTSYNGSSAVTITNTGVTSIVAGTNISVSGATGAVTVNVSGTVANATYAVSAGSAGSAGSVTNAVTFNNGGAGDVSGTTYNGGTARTISYNTVGAPSTTGTNASGTWSINVTGSAGSAGSATTAGTVTTAAQPNITSLGTLTRVIVGDGSAASPSMAFASDGAIDTGFYWGGDGYINWTNNGVKRGQFRPDGTAEIGTVLTTTLTTGANTTAGTITGNWSLSSGSRLNATYADLAEKYTADAGYEPGTVLVFGGEHEVTLSTEKDSFRVAGVVTTNPAYTMNNDCEGEHVATIALQGRVPAKVIGPVYKGDLLVSTSNGYATANNIARAGTIIGKSLENFTGATGIIEVAVGRF